MSSAKGDGIIMAHPNMPSLAILMIAGFTCGSASAATYSWYFSYSTGDDNSGQGTLASPWKTLAKVQSQENTLSSSDVAAFYFKRGDTWTFTHTGSPTSLALFDACPVTIDAYGTGARPVFDGGVLYAIDPSTGKPYDPLVSPATRNRYDVVFNISFPGSSIKNIEVRNHHGNALLIGKGASHCVIQNCLLHNLGQAGIHMDGAYTMHDNLAEYCTVHDSMRNMEVLESSNYGGGINMAGVGNAADAPYNNTVRYCNVYNNYGEGVWNVNGITEYNVIGDTWSAGVHTPPQRWAALTSIVRYNLIYSTASSKYKAMNNGIKILDEGSGGSNSNGEFWIYGNIIINRRQGVWLFDSLGYSAATPYKKVRVFNNTFIDCAVSSLGINNPDSFADVKIYNNASIFYSASGGAHAVDNGTLPNANIDIRNNFFWPVNSTYPVDSNWTLSQKTGDPKLPKKMGWRSLSNDKDTIDFLTSLYPEAGSALLGGGMTLNAEFNGMTALLTQGTHVDGNLGSSSFVLQDQRAQSAFALGAVTSALPGGSTPSPPAPTGLRVK
jgi:hypothetical protein